MLHCPCGLIKTYSECCGRFIDGNETASTPEELMRSRYTAYTRINIDYIIRTMKPPANIGFDADATKQWAEDANWSQLDVLNARQQANRGFVEYIAQYYMDNRRHVLHEMSEFLLENGQWYYINGKGPYTKDVEEAILKISRNDLCPCGSKKKYKKCCGN